MKNTLFALLILIPGWILSQNSFLSSTFKKYNQVHGLFVGISDYDQLQDLQFAANDARLMYDLYSKIYPEQTVNFQLFINDHATDLTIIQALKQLSEKVKSGDLIIFSFSGHADALDENGYFLAHNASQDRVYELGGAIDMDFVNKVFRKIHEIEDVEVLIVIDCMNSVTFTSSESNYFRNQAISTSANTTRIFSCALHERSFEDSSLGYGVFTYFLAKGITGAADIDSSGYINFDELNTYLKSSVRKSTNGQQTPSVLTPNEFRDFLLLNTEIREFGKTFHKEAEGLDIIEQKTISK